MALDTVDKGAVRIDVRLERSMQELLDEKSMPYRPSVGLNDQYSVPPWERRPVVLKGVASGVFQLSYVISRLVVERSVSICTRHDAHPRNAGHHRAQIG